MTHRRQREPSLAPRNDGTEDENGPELCSVIAQDTVPSFRYAGAEGVEILDGAAAARADVGEDAVCASLCFAGLGLGGGFFLIRLKCEGE